MRPRITLIAAMAQNRVIGRNGKLPWHLAEDLRKFRELTWGKSILMGRCTFESIGRPLPGRHNIVVTSRAEVNSQGCTVVKTLEEGLAATASEELMVIGGASIYAALAPYATRLYLTLIHADYPGDTFFPVWPLTSWREVYRIDRSSEGFPHAYSFVLLERN